MSMIFECDKCDNSANDKKDNTVVNQDFIDALKYIHKSGPVSRPVSEIVAYAHVLEIWFTLERDNDESEINQLILELRKYICPHWEDVLKKPKSYLDKVVLSKKRP